MHLKAHVQLPHPSNRDWLPFHNLLQQKEDDERASIVHERLPINHTRQLLRRANLQGSIEMQHSMKMQHSIKVKHNTLHARHTSNMPNSAPAHFLQVLTPCVCPAR
jgi:hypothetical protein